MTGIILSTAVRENLLSLQNTASLLSTTQNKLATGLRVNSALDDPAAFFTAQGLNNRASDLNRLLDNTGLAVQTLKAADKSLGALTKLVEQAKSTALQARNTKVKENTAEGDEASAGTTGLNGHSGSGSLTISAGHELVISRDGVSDFTIAAGTLTKAGLATAISSEDGLSASLNGDNHLVITEENGRKMTLSGGVATAMGVEGTRDNGVSRDSFETDYNNLLTQMDQLAGDSSYNGVNLLSADDLSVAFNEDGSSSLNIEGVQYNAAGLGLNALAGGGFATESGIDTVISNLDAAVNTLRSQASTFGNNLAVVENRQTFTKNLIATLESGASGLTLADTNQEAANLLALQTRQSLGSTALSLANQAEQAVLRLF